MLLTIFTSLRFRFSLPIFRAIPYLFVLFAEFAHPQDSTRAILKWSLQNISSEFVPIYSPLQMPPNKLFDIISEILDAFGLRSEALPQILWNMGQRQHWVTIVQHFLKT